MVLPGRRLWLPGLKTGLGLWHGTYRCVEYKWLRWYGADKYLIKSFCTLTTVLNTDFSVAKIYKNF
ncbi:MAG: hypothetical protein GY749_24180 [Desulfobacteraceae bacterium]|nr:hypothetical protein [Desulfobacteraceae bacterium]